MLACKPRRQHVQVYEKFTSKRVQTAGNKHNFHKHMKQILQVNIAHQTAFEGLRVKKGERGIGVRGKERGKWGICVC